MSGLLGGQYGVSTSEVVRRTAPASETNPALPASRVSKRYKSK